MSHPVLTVARIREHLTLTGLQSEKQYLSLLGPARKRPTVDVLQKLLVERNVVTKSGLIDVIRQIAEPAGSRVLLADEVTVEASLPEEAVYAYGALLHRTAEGNRWAMVEDSLENIAGLEAATGLKGLAVDLIARPTFQDLVRRWYLNEEPHNRPDAASFLDFIDELVELGATDMHISVGAPVMYEVSGSLQQGQYAEASTQLLKEGIDLLCEPRHLNDLTHKMSTDVAYGYGHHRLRVNIAHDIYGPTMAIRLLSDRAFTMEELNFPTALTDVITRKSGLIIFSGSTNSGKSTALNAMLHESALTLKRHIITLEDPVEYVLPRGKAAHVNQREKHQSMPTVADGSRDAMRQAPHIAFVGEIRDNETALLALDLANTGHLVYATVHAESAPAIVDRLISLTGGMTSVRDQLARLLIVAVQQQLIPRSSGTGRVAAQEIMLNNTAISSSIRQNHPENRFLDTMGTSRAEGMLTMSRAVAELIVQGVITEEEGAQRVSDIADLRMQLQGLRAMGAGA